MNLFLEVTFSVLAGGWFSAMAAFGYLSLLGNQSLGKTDYFMIAIVFFTVFAVFVSFFDANFAKL